MRKLLLRVDSIAKAIEQQCTGRPVIFAEKIGISERTLYDYLKLLKEFGAPIRYSRHKRSYYYAEEGHFRVEFLKEAVQAAA